MIDPVPARDQHAIDDRCRLLAIGETVDTASLVLDNGLEAPVESGHAPGLKGASPSIGSNAVMGPRSPAASVNVITL